MEGVWVDWRVGVDGGWGPRAWAPASGPLAGTLGFQGRLQAEGDEGGPRTTAGTTARSPALSFSG